MFDINGARQAGYSENEIADFMAQQRGFNISGAREAGYSDNEILSHLDSLQSTDRSFKEIGLDTVKQLGVGVGSTIEGLGTVGMLLGSDRAKSMKDLGNKITEDLRGSYSQGLKNNISEQQQYINEADGEASKFWRTIESTATNPALLATFIAESAPQMLAGGVVGRGVGAGAKLLGAGEALAGKMAIGGAMGTGAVLQGADSASNTYDTLMKLDDGVWSQNQQFKALVEQGADPLQAKDEISKSLARKTLATSGAISLATQGAFSKIGGNAFERALVGQAEKGTVGGIAGKALAEAGSEAIEEGSGQGASNYNVNQVTPTSLFKNVGQSAGQGAITGFTMGGFGGAVEAFKPMTQLVEEEKAKIQAESGNVNAVNNSFNVFGDLAQRSDAINPNIGDINYNQFTQSVDNTTTTPTNTVNVPNVDTQTTQAQEAPTQEAVSKMETTETPQVVKENLTAPTSAENAQVKEPKEVKKPADISEQEFNIIKEVKAVRPYLSNKDIVEAIRSNGKTNTEMRMALGSSKTYKAFKNEQQKAKFKTYKQSKKDSIKFKFDGVTYEADGDTLYTTYKNKRIDNGYKFNPNGKTVFDIFGDNTRMAEAYIQAQGKSTKDFQPDYIAPIQNKIAKAEAMEKQAMQNGDLETAKKVSEAKQGLELQQLQSHPRYQELMDMRKDIASKDTQYSQKLLQPRDIRTVNNGKGNDLEVTGALYTPNYASDFELTKADVKALQSGKATPKIIQKLKSDLGRLDNDPQYQLPIDEQQANDGLLFSKEQQPITKKESISYDGKDIGYIKTTKSGNFVNIDDIQVFKQGTGQGTQAIKNVMAQAEKDGTIVTLTSDAMRGKQNQKKNRELYEKLGFVKNSGANKIKGTKEEFYYKPQQQQANDGLLFSKEPQAKMTKKQLADMDKEYFKAIEDGDMAKVQKMVEDYAKFKGYSKDNTFDKMEHKAPYNDGYSKPLHDMTDIYPDDIYTHGVQYYGDGVHYDRLAIDIMKKVRGNPDARIRVYRAVPKDLKETKLRDGDWITISKEYAKEHGENNLDGKYKIIEQMVSAKHVFTDGNSIHEQGYDSGSNSTYKNNVKGNRKDLSPIIKLYDNENDGAEYIQPLSKRFNEKEEADFYSKGKSKGTTAYKATQIVNKLLGNSKVRQDVEVVQSFDNLPNDIKKRMETISSTDGTVRGVFDPKTNKAYLVADTMAENEVKGVLLHELLHRAINNEVKRQSDKQGQTVSRLDAILGSKLEQVTADLKSLEAKGDKDVLEAVNKAKEAGTPKQHMLEETLAYLLQNQTNKYSTPLKEFLLKVATAIKDFAKRVAVKMGIEPNWLASQITADDIANVLKSYALDDGSAKTSGEPMMSKISDRMKRLMEWHKDSAPETKNADGTPKVFYHGTMAKKQFYEFNTESSPSWFTPNKSYAGAFAPVGGNIFEVYLHVKKPMWVGDIDGIINDVSLKRLSDNSGVPLDKLKDIRKNIKGVNIFNITNNKDFVDIAKSMGYDGIEAIEGRTQTLAVFNPTQIKSVNNKGTFDESNPNILFSRTDDVKKLAKQARSKAKQFLSDQLNKTALERSIDMLSKPKDEAYSAFKSLVMNTLPQKYMDALGEMHKSKNRIEQQVGVVKASLSTLSLEQRTQLHDYIVNDVKTIDPELKKLADKISGIITNLGQELINQGILEAHVVKAWEGKFLKRQFKNEEAVLGTSKFKTYFFGSKKSLAKQYTRGLQLQAETEAEAIKAINGYLKAYGHDEISGMGVNDAIKYLKDNGLFADGVQWKSDGKIKVREMKNGEYEIIRDFTKAEREKMEEVTDAGITVPDTILRLSTLLEHGKMLKATTELNDYVTDDKTMGNSMKWTQIENNPQYGVLAGKWVRPDIASDIIANQNAFYERDGLVDTWLKGLSLWKKSRTVWSPTGHFNNFVSNLFIKHGLGLDPFKNTLEAGKMLSQLQEYEALEVKDAMGTLTAEEQTKFNTMKSYLSSAIELRDNGMLGHTQLLDINRGFEQDGITEEKGALGKLDDAVSKLYKGGDTIHRLSSYMLIKEAGYDSETAMLVVDKLFPDYSKPMPKVWRWARDTGISPFISWTYYTLPAISKITMANPARTLGAYSALGAIGFLGMLLGSDGDWEEAIQSFLNLPEDAIGRRMPIWKNDKGEVLTWKVDRLMPFMDLASPLLGMASGAVKGYKESQGDVGHTAIKAVSGGFGGAGNTVRSYFAGPTINALLFNTAGKDSYTNNDIVKKDATDKQRMYLTAKYLVEQYAPLPTPLMRMYDMTEAMVKGEDERKRNAITVPRSPIENVIGLAGINVLRYDQKALDKQMKDFSAEAQDFTEIKQKLTKLDGMLKESKERKDIDTYNKIISKHQDEMRTLGDLKKTETQLRKLKSMRDEAMMSSDDKAVLELNKQINQIMKAFNERNKK